MTEGLPLILSDGTNSYIYGPGGLPVEQINNATGTVTYLHHDQQGSTRLLTGSTGTVDRQIHVRCLRQQDRPTRAPATTPLGYDGQYTSTDTGLIYLAPASTTRLPHSSSPRPARGDHAGALQLRRRQPAQLRDPSGLDFLEEAGEGIAGWGDTLTFGATKRVREELGINNVNSCSTAYQAGGYAGLATAVLIPGEGEAEVGAESVDAGAASEFGSTPEGRTFTKHYGLETGPERNIPGSVVDQTINESPGVPGRGGTTVHYDPNNDVTVVTGRNGGIVSARRGEP